MSAVAFVNAGSSTEANEYCVPAAVDVPSVALMIVCVYRLINLAEHDAQVGFEVDGSEIPDDRE